MDDDLHAGRGRATSAGFIASPLIQSIGVRGPALAAAAAGSRASARIVQPRLSMAWTACAPKWPVAPMTSAVFWVGWDMGGLLSWSRTHALLAA